MAVKTQNRRISLAHQRGKAARGPQVSDDVVSIWQEILAALHPVIGQRGVAAIYKRSLCVNLAAFPWLAETAEGDQTAIDLPALKAVLTTRSELDAADCGRALVKSFHDLLATLLGRSFTEQLLRSVSRPSAINPVRLVVSSWRVQ